MATLQVTPGVQNNSDTNPVSARGGKQGELMVSELHGRYYEQTYRGLMFSASSQAVVTTTVGLALTYTGLCLSNPFTSAVNLELVSCSLMQSVLQSTQVEAFAIACGFNGTTNVTHTAAVTPKSNRIGSGLVPTGLADSSATLPTAPFYHTFLTNTGTATADSTGAMPVELAGRIILTPGAYALFVTPAQASVAGMWFSFDWIESPI